MTARRRLLLAGGGHSHVEVLRRIAGERPRDLAITLVTPEAAAAHSGMLPGLVAGHYRPEETQVPLAPLAQAANARLVHDRIAALDLRLRVATLASGTMLPFDALSLDVGSVPSARMPGASEHAIAVKPVPEFLDAWERMRVAAREGRITTIAIVGGGAGGVEILLAMHHRLREELGEAAPRFALVTDQPRLTPQHAEGVGRRLGRLLVERNVVLHLASPAVAIEPGAVVVEGHRRVAADAIVLATSASAAPWFAAAGLAVDDRGFVHVDANLRSLSHAFVFAAGDCATIAGLALPKSGLYAVRQGPPLAANLLAHFRRSPLVAYKAQARGLALISTGSREAIVSWGRIATQGRWAWRWKDRIDRGFIARYAVPRKAAGAGTGARGGES